MNTSPVRLTLILFSCFLLPAIMPGQENWIKVLSSQEKEFHLNTLITNKNNNILVAGSRWSNDDPQPFITCINAQGEHLWTKVPDIKGHIWEVTELDNGDLAALYSIYDNVANSYSDYHLMRLSSDGTPQWSIRIMEYTVAPPDIIAIDDDVILLHASTNAFDQYLVRLDSSGQTVWSKCIKNDLATRGSNLVRTDDGGMVFQYFALGGKDVIIKINGDGVLQWVRNAPSASLAPFLEYADGDLLYGGGSMDSQTAATCFVRSKPDGTIVWSRIIDAPYDLGYLANPVLLEDGSVLVSIENTENFKGGLLKIDALGNAEWIKMFFDFSTRRFNHLAKTDDQSIFLLQNQLFTPVSPIIRTNTFGELEECRFESLCYSTQECSITFEDAAIELVDTIITFPPFSPISFVEDTATLVDFCPECPFPSSFFEAPDTLCVGDCFQPEIPCNAGASGYSWFMSGTSPDSSFFPVLGDLCYESTGTYTISRIINANTCPDTFSRTIVVIDAPNYEVPKDTTLCAPPPFVLDISHPRAVNYLWENGSTSNGREILSGGNYRFSITDRYCGEQAIEIDVSFFDEIHAEPPLYLGEDTTICLQSPLTLNAFHMEAAQWLWQDGATETVRSVQTAGTYIVSAQVQDCLVSDTINISVEDCAAKIYFPTAFSQNGDGINDYFFPQGDGFELIIMRIFDRWGGMVFEGNRNHSIWDGQMNGQPVTSGLYTYVAQFRELASGRTVARQGHVLLLR